MNSLVPGDTKAAKASVLRARNSRLSYSESMRIAGAMVAQERRGQLPPRRAFRSSAPINFRALNGNQPEPEDDES